jgi:hypothetical protein
MGAGGRAGAGGGAGGGGGGGGVLVGFLAALISAQPPPGANLAGVCLPGLLARFSACLFRP